MTGIIEISLAVSVMALGYIVTKQCIEIARLKNKLDWLMNEFQSLRDRIDARANQYYSAKANQSEGKSHKKRKKHKHRHMTAE